MEGAPPIGGSVAGEIAWYARAEPAGAWRIAACAEHGRALEGHRFAHAGRWAHGPGSLTREARDCYLCREPQLLDEVARCACEHDSARCPVHQNVGCGG